jgi:ribosomal protein L31E
MADRLLTINIRKYLVTQPRPKRAKKAAKYIRERVSHFTKIRQENIRLGNELNNLIFKRYSRTMVPVKVRVKIGTDTADVLPFVEETAKKPEAMAKDAKKPDEKKSLIKIKKKEEKAPEKPQQEAKKQQ